MKIRPYKRSDSAIIATWVDNTDTKYFFSGNLLPNFPVQDNDLDDYYQSEHERMLYPYVMEDDGKVVGHFFLTKVEYRDRPTARVDLVIVDSSIRGQGYGRKLMQYAIDLARELMGTETLMLDVYDKNIAGQCCYEKVGFKKNGITHIRHYDWGDELILDMEIEL